MNHGYPELYTTVPVNNSSLPIYAAMLLAWSAADIVRYAYFVVLLAGKIRGFAVPGWLMWLRLSFSFSFSSFSLVCSFLDKEC